LTPVDDPWVFSVEPDAVQITWQQRGSRPPGTRLFTGLTPATPHVLEIGEIGEEVEVVTPSPTPGAELTRIATINDLHIGSTAFGVFGRMHEPPADVPHALRCLRDALAQAQAWGARFILVKGDLTNKGTEEEFETVGRELSRVPVPIAIVPGNHEMKPGRMLEPQPALARHGLLRDRRHRALHAPLLGDALRPVLVQRGPVALGVAHGCPGCFCCCFGGGLIGVRPDRISGSW